MASATAKSKNQPLGDAPMGSHVVAKKFKFQGRTFYPGERISYAVYSHPRFETLVHTGLVKAV